MSDERDNVTMSFWRFDRMLKLARKEAWGEGWDACAAYDDMFMQTEPFGEAPVPRPPDNPCEED